MPTTLFFSASTDVKFSRKPDGTGTFSDMKVFKAGTFSDSMGFRRVWTPDHLHQMASNFNLLREKGINPNTPVRLDHSGSITSVIGYVNSLTSDGEFLYASGDITEPTAADMYDRKTLRERSSEIGAYETNNEDLYWPVFRGFAFVDKGAVEGLYSQHRPEIQSVIIEEESPVPEVHKFKIGGQEISDPAVVQAQIATLEGRPGLAAFKIGDAEVSDPAKVQSHIDTLEAFQAETVKAGRSDFVKALIASDVFAASKEDELVEMAEGMSVEAFSAWQALYKDAPAMKIFEKFNANDAGGPKGPQPENDGEELTEKERVTAIVQHHRSAGVSEEKLKDMPSFKRMKELESSSK